MKVQEVLTELTGFKTEVEKVLQRIGKIEFNENDKEENFLNVELMGIISDLSFACECTSYINKPVAIQGILNIKGSKFFIDNFELKNFDVVEFFTDGYWIKIEIIEIQNEFYAENLTSLIKANKGNLIGRIRLTEEELNNR